MIAIVMTLITLHNYVVKSFRVINHYVVFWFLISPQSGLQYQNWYS